MSCRSDRYAASCGRARVAGVGSRARLPAPRRPLASAGLRRRRRRFFARRLSSSPLRGRSSAVRSSAPPSGAVGRARPSSCAGAAAACARGPVFGCGRFSAIQPATSWIVAEALAGGLEQLRRARRVALGGGEQRGADFLRHLERGVDELRGVLLVAMAARVGERAEQPLRVRVLLRRLAVELLAHGPREPPRPAREDLIGRVGLALGDRAQQDPHAGRAILLPRRRLRDERDEVVEVGASRSRIETRSASAISRSRRFGFCAAHVERNVSIARFEAPRAVSFSTNAARSSKRSWRPAISPQNSCSSSSRNFGSTRCHSRAITTLRRSTSGVTGTSHDAGVSLRRARRWTRRRGAGVTRAPSR